MIGASFDGPLNAGLMQVGWFFGSLGNPSSSRRVFKRREDRWTSRHDRRPFRRAL